LVRISTPKSSRTDAVIPVVADADTLFGATTRGLLIHLDAQGLIRLHWSELILDELSRALVDTGRKADAAAATQHERLLRATLPHAEVPIIEVQSQFAAVTSAVRSAKDTHVAACAHALLAGSWYPRVAHVSVVTRNTRDFGIRRLAALGIEVQRPDDFLLGLWQTHSDVVAAAFAALRSTCDRHPRRQHCSSAWLPTVSLMSRAQCSTLGRKVRPTYESREAGFARSIVQPIHAPACPLGERPWLPSPAPP
jgi:hypothetical protein